MEYNSKAELVRNFTFGVEDSLVSTVGLLSGVAAAGLSGANILITGTVLIFVEAFSMGVGSLLSEQSVQEYQEKKVSEFKKNLKGAALMFISYFFAGYIPLGPYIFFPVFTAFPLSIIMSLLFLFILGAASGKAFKTGIIRGGLRMLVIGGFAIALGVMVGQLIK